VHLEEDAEENDDEVLSEISEELSFEEDGPSDEEDDDSQASEQEDESEDEQEEEEGSDKLMKDAPIKLDDLIDATEEKSNKDKKRKRKNNNDDLEGKYLDKIAAEEEAERAGKRQKNDALNKKTEKPTTEEEDAGNDSDVPVHETLVKDTKSSDLDKANRTVFLANVSTEAINSKSAKKTLMAHLASVLEKDATPPQTIESLRFRSVAFAGSSLPKRAAYITKSLMDATTKSANAYVVYSTPAAARTAATKLNGTQVLDRHLRVDSVAHPSPTDHRRCVFVGNLGFVDDETILNTNADGETTEKKKNKIPSDIEEGLWRTFSTQGKVENVRVVRDPKTRVGKGFAYVQFYVSPRSCYLLSRGQLLTSFYRTATMLRLLYSLMARSFLLCFPVNCESLGLRTLARQLSLRSAPEARTLSAMVPPRAQNTSTRPRLRNSPWLVVQASSSAARPPCSNATRSVPQHKVPLRKLGTRLQVSRDQSSLSSKVAVLQTGTPCRRILKARRPRVRASQAGRKTEVPRELPIGKRRTDY
jgi:RNA recognition motif-containing protein